MGLFQRFKKKKKTSSGHNLAEVELQVISFANSKEINEKDIQIGYDDGILVFPAGTALNIVTIANGDPRVIEKMLDFPDNYLGETPLIIGIRKENVYNLRIPSGNEKIYVDLDDHWIPGGKRKTNIPEAIIDPVARDKVFIRRI